MGKKGLILSVTGAVLGVLTGIAVISAQNYLSRLVVELLAEEVKISTGCDFHVDRLGISILTLSGSGANARIECEGGDVPLRINKLKASISLSKLRQKIIVLSRLQLIGASARGVLDESATFRFIDSLLTPAPPGKEKSSWRAQLDRLELIESSFTEPLGGGKLFGENLSILALRTPGGDYDISPKLERLSYAAEGTLTLGAASANLHIADDEIVFHKISLALNESLLELSGREVDSLLQGIYQFTFNADDSFLAGYLEGKIRGSGEVSGTLSAPRMSGSTLNDEQEPLKITAPFIGSTEVESFTARHAINHGDQLLNISHLVLEADLVKLRQTKPFIIKNGNLSGSIAAEMPKLTVNTSDISGLNIELSISGTTTSPVLTAAGVSEAPALRYQGELSNQAANFAISSANADYGELNLSGGIDLREAPPLLKGSLKANAFQIGAALGMKETLNLYTDLNGTFEGPLDIRKLKSDVKTEIYLPDAKPQASLHGSAKLEDGTVSLEMTDANSALNITSKIPLLGGEPSTIAAKVSDFAASGLGGLIQCFNFSGALNYNFTNDKPLLGSGGLALDKILIGCAPYSLGNSAPLNFPINTGVMQVNGVLLKGADPSITDSVFKADGTLSAESVNIKTSANIQARSFLSLMPRVDDLRGLIRGEAVIGGSISKPQFSGEITISEGEFDSEVSSISAQKINGRIELIHDALDFKGVSGTLNGGNFTLEGLIDLIRMENSNLQFNFSNIIAVPIDGLNVDLSGEIGVSNITGAAPLISGQIIIESGEYQRNIEITNLLRTLPAYLLNNDRGAQPEAGSELPDADLDIKISGEGGLFIFTGWLNAELGTDLNITGKLNDPAIAGSIEVNNGWLGFKDRRFEIIAGKLHFSPTQKEPQLELLAEAFILSRTGDNVQVILESSGSISAPKISLSSDRNLSESDLLALITSGSNLGVQTSINSLQSTLDFDERDFDVGDILFNPENLIKFLTEIDSLSIEPSYNYITGSIDPAIVARKELFDRLMLEGESFLGSTQSLSRAQLVYSLTPRLSIAGVVESRSTVDQTAIEIQATYTVLASRGRYLEIEIDGNKGISDTTIRNNLRVNENSRLPCSQQERLKNNLLKLYLSRGYFAAQVTANVECSDGRISRLHFDVQEHSRSYVEDVVLTGDSPDSIIDTGDIREEALNSPATAELLTRIRQEITNKLRSEGYISSRVGSQYEAGENENGRKLVINTFLGKPVTFTFIGNTIFSPREFLETINLFDRKLPLGSNTINLLIEGIEKKYRDAGYLYATIRYQKTEDPQSNRINYIIEIREEEEIEVDKVVLAGNQELPQADLEMEVRARYGKEKALELFKPTAARAEVIDHNIQVMTEIYKEKGFSDAKISYRLVPNRTEAKVSILYLIDEGEELRSRWLEIEGMPPDVGFNLPKEEYSIPAANSLIDSLQQELRSKGYFSASFVSEFDPALKKLSLMINAGEPAVISEIVIDGNEKISDATILENMTIKPGDQWDNQQIHESKRRLLRLGLFVRVDLDPADGQLDGSREILLVKVIERPLQSLEVGGGINSIYGTHIFSKAIDRSLFKDGKSLSLVTDIYYDPRETGINQGIASLIYSHPNFLGTEYNLTEDLRYQKLENTAHEFDLDRGSLASSVYRALGEHTSASFGHTILTERLNSVPDDVILGPHDSGDVRLSFLSGFLTYDLRDAPLNPTEGTYFNFDYKLAAKALGSEADFYSLGARASWIEPLSYFEERLSFAASSSVGSAWTFGGTDQVPISQRFYTGGRTSIRGFRENALGPRGSEGHIIGGDTLFANNFELRYLAAENTSVHTFFDAGTVFLRERSLSLDDIRTSAGVGIRYLSAIGPIGFDLGHPLDEQRGEPSVRLHFSIGTNF